MSDRDIALTDWPHLFLMPAGLSRPRQVACSQSSRPSRSLPDCPGEDSLLIPLRHENMRGRRWPVVTFTLIALNTLVFLFTVGPIHDQQPERSHVRVQLLVLAATHPELHMSAAAEAFVDAFKKKAGDEWDKVVLSSSAARNAQAAVADETGDVAHLQEQMDSVCQEFDTQQNTDILDK